jgi:hypothetical protein
MDWVELVKSLQPWATIGGIFVAGISVVVTSRSFLMSSRTNKAKFVFDLTESFFEEQSVKSFWYRWTMTGRMILRGGSICGPSVIRTKSGQSMPYCTNSVSSAACSGCVQ